MLFDIKSKAFEKLPLVEECTNPAVYVAQAESYLRRLYGLGNYEVLSTMEAMPIHWATAHMDCWNLQSVECFPDARVWLEMKQRTVLIRAKFKALAAKKLWEHATARLRAVRQC